MTEHERVERPHAFPISRTDDPTWMQVIKLFKQHGMSEPPVRLRDELVMALEWAWYGHALSALAPQAGDNAEEIRDEAAFLLARLDELTLDDDTDDLIRDWNGHVEPSIARLRAALASHPCTSTPVVSQNAPDLEDKGKTYQDRVAAAHHALFHDDPTDVPERRARFFEEANETCQAFGMTREEAHQLVDYTYSRPAGEPKKEIGGAYVTLTSLCVEAGINAMECAEADLAKLMRPETIERIRAKRSTRHGRGPLPGFDPSACRWPVCGCGFPCKTEGAKP